MEVLKYPLPKGLNGVGLHPGGRAAGFVVHIPDITRYALIDPTGGLGCEDRGDRRHQEHAQGTSGEDLPQAIRGFVRQMAFVRGWKWRTYAKISSQ